MRAAHAAVTMHMQLPRGPGAARVGGMGHQPRFGCGTGLRSGSRVTRKTKT